LCNPHSVDRLCEGLLLTRSARVADTNLIFVRERLLRSEVDIAALLELYQQVWRGRRVPVDENNPLVESLRLSGVTRVKQGQLRVRNRIYARVFDREWVRTHMPDAELRRQKAAFQRGLLRTAGASSAILAVVGGLAVSELSTARREVRNRRLAEHYLYAADMNLAQQ